jgi:hypothetical protein
VETVRDLIPDLLTNAGYDVVTAKDGERLWTLTYAYQQKQFCEVPELEVFQAENCKVLKEQMNFAANQTVSEFIKDLKKGLGQ